MYTYMRDTHLIFLNVCVTWLKQTFEEADKNGDGLLNIEEIYQLLHKLNVNLPRRKVKQMFQVRIWSIFISLTAKLNTLVPKILR